MNKTKAYILIESLLYLCLLVLQVIYISKGFVLTNKEESLFTYIAILHVAITFGSFLYAVTIFLKNKKKKKEDLFILYFLFILIADIFFSFPKLNIIAHIFFALAYILFMVIRRAKLFEYSIVLLVGIIGIILAIIGKISYIIGIDFILGSSLLLNTVFVICKYIKDKKKENLYIMIALISILISDLTIALSTLKLADLYINMISLITWPTYIIGCILLNKYYKFRTCGIIVADNVL